MPESLSLDALVELPSEARNPRTGKIDLMETGELLRCINDEDRLVAEAVGNEIPAITAAVDAVVEAFRLGGRLVYMGAGTSGRLGVLDASECSPTFSVSEDMVVGLIAGGDYALRHPIEGAEDSPDYGRADLEKIKLRAEDVVVGVAVSGRTPYVVGGIEYGKMLGCVTVGVTCNPSSIVAKMADISIAPLVGPEVITGSTRLKSGSAQKMILNMISTASMIRIGKVYENLMVDLNVSNIKLMARARGIVAEIAGLGEAEAASALERAEGEVKTAVMMAVHAMTLEEARKILDAHGGVLRRAMEAVQS